MIISLQKMKKIHEYQVEMIIELIKVMDILDIRYYFVHGSLLGAIQKADFIPEDDDIDIAIFRQDYNKLLKYGNDYLPNKYFLQSSLNDDYPLAFAKMRNSQTAFIQPVLDKYNCNKGIYIDVFPIDFTSTSKLLKIKEKLLQVRINLRFNSVYKNKSIKSRIARAVSFCLFPSYRKAIIIRENIYSRRSSSNHVCLTGGKKSEQFIPIDWFGDGVIKNFNAVTVSCPSNFKEYLTQIYGINYFNINPASERITKDNRVEVSANLLSFDKSYKCF